MKRTILVLILLVGAGFVCVGAWHYIILSKPVETAVGIDPRNDGVEVRLGLSGWGAAALIGAPS